MVRETVARGGTLFFCGNGGSAADAQHIATEYVVRYMRNRARVSRDRARRPTRRCSRRRETTSGSTRYSRDRSRRWRKPGDLLIIHSTSGNSPNVLRAAEAARAKGVRVLAFSARDGGELRALADHIVVIPTSRTDRAQELHLCVEHLICDFVEQLMIEGTR